MTESFAGITVPSGSVGDLRSSGSRLSHQASVLADTSQRLSGMPSAASSWIGPAHSAYANRCIRASTAAGLAAQSFTMAAGAAEAYAGELEKAKHTAREAIDDARRAQKTIDHAKQEISLAQGRQRSAQTRIDAAQHAVAVAAMAPGGDTGAAAALLHAAEHDLERAQHDERHWTHVLHRAQDDLRDARRRGNQAEQDARDAAQAARTLFAAAGASMPVLPPPPAPVQPPKDTRHWWQKAADWTWDQAKAVPGAAKDATVGLATGLYNDVHDGLEYRYNQIAHPELAFDYEMDQQRKTGQMLSNPVGAAKQIVDWDDLSHGRVGAWIGGLAPDAALVALTAGGGSAVRIVRGTRTVQEMRGPAALRRVEKRFNTAAQVRRELKPSQAPKRATVAAAKKLTISGWADRPKLPKNFERVRPETVKRLADEVDVPLLSAGARDYGGGEPGWPGKFHASHAEAQQLAARFGQPVGVSKPMCDVCQDLYQGSADYTGHPLLTQDPDHVRLFLPGHHAPILDPSPEQFPGARPMTADDLHRGLGAGAGAVAAAPRGQP